MRRYKHLKSLQPSFVTALGLTPFGVRRIKSEGDSKRKLTAFAIAC